MTIRKRLTLWYAALLTIIIILFGAITFGVMRFTMINNLDQTLNETANLIAVNSRIDRVIMFGQTERVLLQLAPLDVFRASGVYVQAWELVNDEKVLLDKSANLDPINDPLDDEAFALRPTEDYISNVVLRGVNLRVLTQPVKLENERIVGYLQVAVDLETVNQATELLLLVMLVSCGFAIFGAGALSLWFSDRALKPINAITQAASSIAGTNDLSTRLDWHGPRDELGSLTSVFNKMMGRIEHLFSVQQRFVADISHELRTPLTAIQGNVELMKRYGVDEMSLNDIETESKRMSRLVNDLLMLARADYGGIEIETYPLDLDTVVMDAYTSSQNLLTERDLNMTMTHFEAVRVEGNADRLKQAITNLIANAVKFTDDGGQIAVALKREGDEAVITVRDTGIGIDAEHISRVFDRFYQSDPSRSQNEEGFGLGLSIAKWIVEAHNGTIEAQSQVGEGTTFIVRLPIYDPDRPPREDTTQAPTRPRIPVLRWNRQQQQHHDQSGNHYVNHEANGHGHNG